jgi:hypothetical protein
VGDDLENDGFGPRRAGLASLVVDREGRSPAGLDALPSLAALVDLLPESPRRGLGRSTRLARPAGLH